MKIPVKWCPTCSCAFYPNLYDKGLISIHNKVMVSFDFLMDMINVLRTGGPLTETIQQRIRLLGVSCGIGIEEVETDLKNLAIKIEKSTVALACLLISVSDLDDVMCYICGAAPKNVSSGIY